MVITYSLFLSEYLIYLWAQARRCWVESQAVRHNGFSLRRRDNAWLSRWRDSLTRWDPALSSTRSFTSSNLSVSLLSSHLITRLVSRFSCRSTETMRRVPEAEGQSDREVFTGSNTTEWWFTSASHVHQSGGPGEWQSALRCLFTSRTLPILLSFLIILLIQIKHPHSLAVLFPSRDKWYTPVP